jgi:predicted  nucleic acid-binding Zn-ribbon protein
VSIEAKIETLKSIAALDAELLALQSELRAERVELEKKAGRRSELGSRAEVLESSLAEMEKTRGALYGELRQLSVQVERAREKMARCRNEREANAASRELEELRRIQREREKEIEKLVGLADEARADLDKVQGQHSEVSGEMGDTGAAVGEKMGNLESRIGEKQRARDELAATFDKVLLRRYDTVRSRRGTGIAAVEKGTCTACHIELAPRVYQQMMHRKELFTCPSCLRILYLAPAAPPASSEAPSDTPEG